MIQHSRTKIARDLANRLDAHLDEPDGRLQFVDELETRLRLVVAQLVDEPHELEFEAREHLPELVVQLSRDSRALFLASQLQSKREGTLAPGLQRARGEPRPSASRARSLHLSSEVLLITNGQ